MNKKGVSGILVTVLIIAIVLVAILIVYNVVVPLISKKAGGISTSVENLKLMSKEQQ
tara:strand:+ start:6504 stop:6674 length:171 start_codon:yes stop_codon:yes gene_type:complete